MTIIVESLEGSEKSIARLEGVWEESESFLGVENGSWGVLFYFGTRWGCFPFTLPIWWSICVTNHPLPLPRLSPSSPHKISSRAHNTTRTIARSIPNCVHHRETFLFVQLLRLLRPTKTVINTIQDFSSAVISLAPSSLLVRHLSCFCNFWCNQQLRRHRSEEKLSHSPQTKFVNSWCREFAFNRGMIWKEGKGAGHVCVHFYCLLLLILKGKLADINPLSCAVVRSDAAIAPLLCKFFNFRVFV